MYINIITIIIIITALAAPTHSSAFAAIVVSMLLL